MKTSPSFLCLLLAISLSNATYSKYKHTCQDIGCPGDEECVMQEDVCTLNNKNNCGKYPTCTRTNKKQTSCATYTCPPSQVCKLKNNTPRCVDSGSPKQKRQVQSYNQGGYNPSAPYPPHQGSQIYPPLPQPGYHGGNTGSHYPGQSGYPGQSNYPNQPGYPGQQHGNQPYPGQTNPSQSYPGQTYPGQTNPGQNYPGQTYPGQTSYPGGQTSYPGGQTSYPGGQTSYPGGQTSYPGGQTSYPGGQTSYPGGQPHSGQTYPNQHGNTGVDFYKDQTRNQGGNYGSQNYNPSTGRRYKRTMQGRNYGTNVYNQSGGYNEPGTKGGHNLTPSGNTYPIPPGYTGHSHQTQHSGNTYPSQQSNYGGRGQTYPNNQNSQTYPGRPAGQTGHNTDYQTGRRPQSGSNYHESGSNQPTYTSQTGDSRQSAQGGGSYSDHRTQSNQNSQGGRDFYQDQTKGSQQRNQGTQHPNYNQGGRRYSRSIQDYYYNQNGYSNYPNHDNNYSGNKIYPPLSPNYKQTTPRYHGYPYNGVGNGYPHQPGYPTQPGSYPSNNNFHQQVQPQYPYNNYPSGYGYSNSYDNLHPTPKPSNSIWNSVSNFFKDIVRMF